MPEGDKSDVHRQNDPGLTNIAFQKNKTKQNKQTTTTKNNPELANSISETYYIPGSFMDPLCALF